MIANAKLHLVELKNQHDIPELLEAEYTSQAHTKLAIMKDIQIQEDGKPEYDSLLENWKEWIEKNLVKSVLEKRKLRKEDDEEEKDLLA